MPAGRKLIEMRFVTHRLQLGGHLAGMARMRPVIATARGDQDRWIGMPQGRDVIGGYPGEEFPILRIVGITVFVSDRRTNEELVVAAHVDDRHRAKQTAKPLRIPRQHISNEKATVRPAFRSDATRTGHSSPDEIGCDSRKII